MIKYILHWLIRIASVVLLYFFCDRNLNINFSANHGFPYWTIPVLVVLQVFVLYSFFLSVSTPAKFRVLRQTMALTLVILSRWEAIAQGFEFGTPWSRIGQEIFTQMPYILLLHVPVQIAFSVVFYHLERRKQVQAL